MKLKPITVFVPRALSQLHFHSKDVNIDKQSVFVPFLSTDVDVASFVVDSADNGVDVRLNNLSSRIDTLPYHYLIKYNSFGILKDGLKCKM